MINKFKEYLEEESLSDNTVENYIRDVKQFIYIFKDKFDEDIKILDHMLIAEYIKELKVKNMTSTSINRKLSAVRKYNEFLVSVGIQKDIVVKKKDYIKLQPKLYAPYSPSEKEVFKVKSAVKSNKRNLAIITMLAHSGIRVSELINLKQCEVNMESKYFIINGKGNKTRTLPMASVIYDTLNEYFEERKEKGTLDKNKYVFVGRQNSYKDKPLDRTTINKLLKVESLVSIVKLHPHLFRNYFCTEAANKKVLTIEQIAALAGHYDLDTTKKYINLQMLDLIDAVNAV